MKPITLKIAGLHSFREEQEIPFDKLSELGVFGIFGPTGSGKSSILDAMTLALYGTVVRAGRRTQGILNHAEKHVKVSLTFSLGQGTARHVYRVERRYVRKDQLAVGNTHSRLVVVTVTGEEVLADKEREVTDQVTQLLGLREEDFTTAVVLPQGKFAEFLNLGGKERREMLQRLFSLEQYGNILIKKVNDRFTTAETGYIEVESEQKGLGDASPAAVAQVLAMLAAARKAEEAAVMRHQAAQQQYTEAKEVIVLQQELIQKQAELAAHRQRDQEIKAAATALAMAEKAGRAALIWEELAVSEACEQAAAKSKQQITGQVTRLTADTKELQAAYAATREKRLQQEPRLIERKAKLEAAISLEAEAAKLAQAAADLEQQQLARQAACQAAGLAVKQQTKRSEELTAGIKKLEQQQAAASIGTELRLQAQACQEAAYVLQQQLVSADKIKQAGVLRKQHCDRAQTAAKQAAEQLCQAERKLNELEAAEAKAAEEQLQAAAAQLDLLVTGEKQAAAARLAGELKEGTPCPVCGSTAHPQLVSVAAATSRVNFEQEIAAAKEHIAKLTQSLAEAGKAVAAERQSLNQVRTAAATLSQQVVSALAELDTVRDEYREVREQVAAAREQLVKALQAAGKPIAGDAAISTVIAQVSELNEYITEQDRLAGTLAKQLISHRQDYEACQAEITRWQRAAQSEEAELAALTARLTSLNELLAAKRQELYAVTEGIPASQLLARAGQKLETVRREERLAQESYDNAAAALTEAGQACIRADTSWQEAAGRRDMLKIRFDTKLAEEGFTDAAAMTAALMPEADQEKYRSLLKTYAEAGQWLTAQSEQLAGRLKGRSITETEWELVNRQAAAAEADKNAATEQRVEADKEYRDLSAKHQRWSELETARLELKDRRDCLQALKTLLRGNVFIEFLAQEQMELVARQASDRLKQITQHRYALEMSSDGGFLIRDDANGGVRRPVSTLSGGETFQASLALALALSVQIQLKGKYPLEFFFLDEGFGSLDQYALDVAMSTLEKLHMERLTIGVISHVAELKQRMPRRLLVEPAEPAGRGSRVQLEEA